MAWRDGKASLGRLFLFMASIVLGIAAVVSIQSFSDNLKKNISLQSKSLMGADYIIESNHPPDERVQEIIDSLGGADAREISFASMMATSRTGNTKLMQVRGIEKAFPFYGKLETTPSGASESLKNGKALVDATTMLQMNLKVGDSIKIGKVILPVGGALNSTPGSSGLFSSIAPPVFIPYGFIEETELVKTGSRIDYKFYFKANASTDLEKLEKKLNPILDAHDADIDTHLSTSRRLGRRYENFGKFLNLVAFVALLLGCIGIASAIHIYIQEKLKSVAILKCLGASSRQTFIIFLIQLIAIGLLGSILGILVGLGLQQLFPLIMQDFLPLELEISIAWKVIFMGMIIGVSMAVLFGLYPLTFTLKTSPLQALRIDESKTSGSKKAGAIIGGLLVLFLFGFSFWLLEDWKYSLSFLGGIAVVFLCLAGIAGLFIYLIRHFFPSKWSFEARQSLLNLFRPQNQTLILILAIGLGAFLISTLYFTKDMLLSQAKLEDQANSPNLILLDVQTNQKDSVAQTVRAQDLPVIEAIPIVTMKVKSLAGKPVEEIRKDTTSQINRWILDHEFRTTYRDSLISSESISNGNWVPKMKDDQEIVPISVSEDFAKDAEVSVGDEIIFNVQGVLLKTNVESIRKVDWSRMQMNFSIVFPKGVLEEAPQFLVLTTKTPNPQKSAELQQAIVEKFPNVSIIDLRQVLSVIQEILNKISWLINFMSAFSIITGIIVLIGAVRTSKYQRIKESVLLRTLGARKEQILKILALEYLFLGMIGCITGIFLSLLGSLLLAYFVFDSTFIPSVGPFVFLLPAIVILVVVIGLSSSLSVLKSPPLQVLRKEV
ncbi:hypothetical protein C7S20_17175 [Christiangramia fulva]|uniref:ABC transporter permease n=2 Tax=Christiangramia fulva TaxID=2126553 RepID=A0A2R3ZB70_9FLAO|nr:hypothetical protein C7S20_17175 [Christiangramia fulva]